MVSCARVKQLVLRDHLVDVLCVDDGVSLDIWFSWLEFCDNEKLPLPLVVMLPGSDAVCEGHGKRMKGHLRALSRLKFNCFMFSMNALDYGAAVDQERLVYVFCRAGRVLLLCVMSFLSGP